MATNNTISKAVRDAIEEKLSDDTTGFNAQLAAIADEYDLEDEDVFKIDWSDDSLNFFYGNVAPDLVEATSPFTYPLLTIDTARARHDNFIKFADFAGTVTAVVSITITWEKSQVLPDFSKLADAVEFATFMAINKQDLQDWPNGVEYAGIMELNRGGIFEAGENWRQQLVFTLNFRRIIPVSI